MQALVVTRKQVIKSYCLTMHEKYLHQSLSEIATSVVADHEEFEIILHRLIDQAATLDRIARSEELENTISLYQQALEIFKCIRDGKTFKPYLPNSAYDQLRQLITNLMHNN